MLSKMGKECVLDTESRRMCEDIEAKISTLEFSLAEVAPLSEGNRLIVDGSHRQRITVDNVLREHIGGSADETDPRGFLNAWVDETLANSDEWFAVTP